MNLRATTKRSLLLCVIFMLGGCNRIIPGYQVDSFIKQCANHGGVHAIDAQATTDAICRDGVRVQWERAPK